MQRLAWTSDHDPLRLGRHALGRPGEATAAGDRGTPGGVERSLLDLQRTAGNRAVVAALRQLVVQRQPKRKQARPKWADEAKKSLEGLFPKDALIKGVAIEDYRRINDKLKDFDYSAWTNSEKVIYVKDTSGLADPDNPATKDWPRQALLMILHHEAQHVRQFHRDGAAPRKWETMLRYEMEAYQNDVDWLNGDGAKVVTDNDLRKQLIESSSSQLTIVKDLLAESAKVKDKDREAKLRERMIATKMIPPGAPKDPQDLYKQPPL